MYVIGAATINNKTLESLEVMQKNIVQIFKVLVAKHK